MTCKGSAERPPYLVATVEGGELLIDGEPVTDHPYRSSMRGFTVYYPQGTDCLAIESYMRENDSAYTGSRHGAVSYTFRGESSQHSLRIAPAAGWGISARDVETVTRELDKLYASVREERWTDVENPESDINRWTWGKAATTLAGRLCSRYATELRQLPARWRTLAHNAIHQGPQVVCRGGAANALCYDRSEAFLRALFEPVPLRDSWQPLAPGARWSRYARTKGIVRATVRIAEDYPNDIPPLPVRDLGSTVYGCGLVRGVWTTQLLAEAVDRGGVEVVEVHEAARCEVEPIHAWAGERIAAVKDKRLRKLLYTRYWGRLAAMGGWRGTVEYPEGYERGTVHRFAGSDLYWVWDGYNLESHQCSPDYRPDHAAFIAADNHRRMNQELARIPAGAVIATHVDAVWVDSDTRWYPSGDDFRLKREGPLRFYAIGTYDHDGKLAAQGYEGEPLTSDRLREWSRNLTPNPAMRHWTGAVTPNADAGAVSRPNVFDTVQPLPGLTIYAPQWTRRGWIRKPDGAEEDSDGEVARADYGE